MKMKKPNTTYPKGPKSTPPPFPNVINDPSLQGQNFEQLLEQRGIRFLHRRATPCPNLRTIDDRGHDPNCTFCQDGYVYYGEQEIVGVFYGNALDRLYEIQGEWEIGQAVITFPAEYASGEQADFNSFDQLVIPDFTMRLWEMKEYQETADGLQRLRYPIVNTDYVAKVDKATNTLVELEEGVDFEVVGGNIRWLPGKEPGIIADPDTQEERGELITYSYFAYPVFIVQHLMHELRATQQYNPATGEKITIRLPQQVLVKKDFIVRLPENRDGTIGTGG